MNNHEHSIWRNVACHRYQTAPFTRSIVGKSAINSCNELFFGHPTIHLKKITQVLASS
jgi:hypothetical protein